MKILRKIKKILSQGPAYIDFLRKEGVVIGKDCSIDKTAEFGTEPYLITLGDHVRITKGVCFVTHDGGMWVLRHLGLVDVRADKMGTINIGDNVNIGWNAIIMPNVTIGRNSIVAAGSIVTKNIPDGEIWGGIPARFIENIETYATKNAGRIVLTNGMSAGDKKEYLIKHYKIK